MRFKTVHTLVHVMIDLESRNMYICITYRYLNCCMLLLNNTGSIPF